MTDIQNRCRSLAINLSTALKAQSFDPKLRVDELNPQYRVKESLLFNHEIAEQLIAFSLDRGLTNQICRWRRNNINQTDQQDQTWYAHQQFLAWRWLEQAYSEASALGAINDGSYSVESTKANAVSELLQEYFPNFKDRESRLATWLSSQPGAIHDHGSRLSLDPTWLAITSKLLTRHQNEDISLDLKIGRAHV